MTKLLWIGLAGATLLAGAPAAAQNADGAALFKRTCSLCHSVEAGKKSALGPNLRGVVGRKAGAAADFNYSPAMKKAGAWTPAQLKAFLANPRGAVPGNKMAFVGLPKPEDRDALVAWLAMQR